jgi:membrane protease YdiL (CAAX protease family)
MPSYLLCLKRHPLCGTFLIALAGALALDAVRRDVIWRTLLYCGAVGVCVLILDFVVARASPANRPLPVRSPVTELLIAAINAIVAFAFLWTQFVAGYRPESGLGRLILGVVGVGSVFWIPLAIMLVALRYRPHDLGVRIRGFMTALPVMSVFAVLSIAFNRDSLRAAFHAQDSFATLLIVGPAAGVSEEFFRLVGQTRVGAWRRNSALGWICASCVWAVLHEPRFWSQSRSLLHASIGVIQILPLGLFFGYMTHRTRSVLPAALVHATNVWGLNNLG